MNLLVVATLLLAPTVLVCSVWGFCYFASKLLAQDEVPFKRMPQETPYDRRYSLCTAELPESKENIEKKVVSDETPEGRVVMRLQDDLFEYWADKAMPYKYLETVARKYVIVHDCRDRYINIFKELLLAHEAKAKEVPEIGGANSVFAKFKKEKKQADNRLVNARANRYKWRGKLAEFDAAPQEVPEAKVVNYASYVQMHKID
jgi:hypothetical protein